MTVPASTLTLLKGDLFLRASQVQRPNLVPARYAALLTAHGRFGSSVLRWRFAVVDGNPLCTHGCPLTANPSVRQSPSCEGLLGIVRGHRVLF
jgi:hypothetical protein